jgi:hypothetical protein
MMAGSIFDLASTVWQWRPAEPSAAGWHFITIDGQTAAEIRFAALGRVNAFGSIRVVAQIGDTRWQTSLFPHRETGGFLLPVKADVRRREKITEGSEVTVRLEV